MWPLRIVAGLLTALACAWILSVARDLANEPWPVIPLVTGIGTAAVTAVVGMYLLRFARFTAGQNRVAVIPSVAALLFAIGVLAAAESGVRWQIEPHVGAVGWTAIWGISMIFATLLVAGYSLWTVSRRKRGTRRRDKKRQNDVDVEVLSKPKS